MNYRIRRCQVPLCLTTNVNLEKSWSLNISINKNIMSKTYSELDLLFFLFRDDAVIIKQPSSYSFGKIFFISLLLLTLNQVSLSNVFLIFSSYIRPSKVNCIFIIFRIIFLLSNLYPYCLFHFFIFFLRVIVIIINFCIFLSYILFIFLLLYLFNHGLVIF